MGILHWVKEAIKKDMARRRVANARHPPKRVGAGLFYFNVTGSSQNKNNEEGVNMVKKSKKVVVNAVPIPAKRKKRKAIAQAVTYAELQAKAKAEAEAAEPEAKPKEATAKAQPMQSGKPSPMPMVEEKRLPATRQERIALMRRQKQIGSNRIRLTPPRPRIGR